MSLRVAFIYVRYFVTTVPAGKRVFEFKWCMCGPGICHQPKYLSVAQIIPKTGEYKIYRLNNVGVLSGYCPNAISLDSETVTH